MEQADQKHLAYVLRAAFCYKAAQAGASLWRGDHARAARLLLRLLTGGGSVRQAAGVTRNGTGSALAARCAASEARLAAARSDPACGAFLPDGLIGSQQALGGIGFGRCGNSPENGCGWIAAYNALRLLGIEIMPGAVLAAVERGARRGGRRGTSPFYLIRWLRRQGVRVRTAVSETEAEAAARECRAYIACYIYALPGARLGGHFAAGRFDPAANCLTVYNGMRGAVAQEPSVAAIDGGTAILRLLIGLDG